MDGHNAQNHLSAANGATFARYALFEKMNFPRNRAGILQWAQENQAPPEIVEHISKLPESYYNSLEEVRKALGEEYENYGGMKEPDMCAGDAERAEIANEDAAETEQNSTS